MTEKIYVAILENDIHVGVTKEMDTMLSAIIYKHLTSKTISDNTDSHRSNGVTEETIDMSVRRCNGESNCFEITKIVMGTQEGYDDFKNTFRRTYDRFAD